MTFLSYMVVIFGYVAPLVFILGMTYRIWNWGHLPIGFSWGLFPKPTKWTVINVLFGKVLALPALLKPLKKVLIPGYIMHLALITIIVLHLELFTPLGAENIIHIIGSGAGMVGFLMVGYSLFRRFGVKETREVSAFSDYFWLSFLLVQVAFGVYIRVYNLVEPETYRAFARSLIILNPILPPLNPWFLIHTFLGEIFIVISIVSGKIMHSAGWFFAQHILASER